MFFLKDIHRMMIYKIHIKSIHIEGGHGAIHIMYNISRLGVVVHGAFYIVIIIIIIIFPLLPLSYREPIYKDIRKK